LLQRMDRPTFRLAVSVCRATADILQRHVCQFFTDILLEHSDPDTFSAEEIGAAHEIIKHLNRACPALLHNVIPQLEEEMRAEDYRLRMAAVQVLAEMFGEEGPGGRECVRRYTSTWEYWMGRRNDKDGHVRVAWVESARGIVLHNEAVRAVVERRWFRVRLLGETLKVW
jgi:sister-chromatid-cohesion protein PDS5